jgi:hypothetical protein
MWIVINIQGAQLEVPTLLRRAMKSESWVFRMVQKTMIWEIRFWDNPQNSKPGEHVIL